MCPLSPSGAGFRLHGTVRIDGIAEFLGRFEEGNAFGRNIDLGSRLWITSGAGIALPRPEASEATNLDLIS